MLVEPMYDQKLLLGFFYEHPLTQPRVVLLSVRKTTTPPPPPNQVPFHFKPLPGNLGKWILVSILILTQLEETRKTTLIFLKMEENLNFFENGRQPQFFGIWKKKIFFWLEDNLHFFLSNGRWNGLTFLTQPLLILLTRVISCSEQLFLGSKLDCDTGVLHWL